MPPYDVGRRQDDASGEGVGVYRGGRQHMGIWNVRGVGWTIGLFSRLTYSLFPALVHLSTESLLSQYDTTNAISTQLALYPCFSPRRFYRSHEHIFRGLPRANRAGMLSLFLMYYSMYNYAVGSAFECIRVRNVNQVLGTECVYCYECDYCHVSLMMFRSSHRSVY